MSISNSETEIVIYGHIVDFTGLDTAKAIEEHYQAEVYGTPTGKIRVRKTINSSITTYEQTIKEKQPIQSDGDIAVSIEFNRVIDPDFFDAFYRIATRRVHKKRYTFEIENVVLKVDDPNIASIEVPSLIYEVDIFMKADGSLVPWCKIDIEIDKVMLWVKQKYPELEELKINVSVKQLPFSMVNTFISANATADQKALIDQLYKQDYNV